MSAVARRRGPVGLGSLVLLVTALLAWWSPAAVEHMIAMAVEVCIALGELLGAVLVQTVFDALQP